MKHSSAQHTQRYTKYTKRFENQKKLANIGPSQNTLTAVKLTGVPFIKRDRLFTHYYRHIAVQLVKLQAWHASVPNKLQYLVWTNQAMLIANSSGIEYIYHGHTVYSLFQSIHWQQIKSQFCGSPFDQTSSTRQTPPFHPSITTSHSMISVLPMQRHHFSRIPHRTCWTPAVMWFDRWKNPGASLKIPGRDDQPVKIQSLILKSPGDYPRNPGSSNTLKIRSVEAVKSITV